MNAEGFDCKIKFIPRNRNAFGNTLQAQVSLGSTLWAQVELGITLQAQVASLRKTKPLTGVLQEEPQMELEGVIARRKSKKKMNEAPEAIALKAAEAEIEALEVCCVASCSLGTISEML